MERPSGFTALEKILGFLLILTMYMLMGEGVAVQAAEYEVRTIDGTNNNLRHPEYGSAGIPLLRRAKVGYEDKIESPAGADRKSARTISNIVAAQDGAIIYNEEGYSDFIWQWGQFIDHDIDLTPVADPPENFNIPVPPGDPYFDPYFEGDKVIPFQRSAYVGGTSRCHPRQQLNTITAFIDASNVYGSDQERAAALRTFSGGKLKTSGGGLYLPYNTEGLPNAGGSDNPELFLAGDERANEQIALTAMHTLFVREHNRLCDEILADSPGLSDEEVYQRARKIVGAELQVITYKEFLPLVLGPRAIPPYRGYNPKVNPGIANEFSTAAYRFGHSMLPPALLRVNRDDREIIEIPLRFVFFNPPLFYQDGGMESLLLGLSSQVAQKVDNLIVDGVRNFLFGEPGEGGFDLAALNMQRGRDHGIANYNSVRKAYRLWPAHSFAGVAMNRGVAKKLRLAYRSPYDMDLWTGGLAEPHVRGAIVGKTFYRILRDQFIRLRNGDRFWYRNDPFFTENQDLLAEVEQTRLAEIIQRNATECLGLPCNVFIAHPASGKTSSFEPNPGDHLPTPKTIE